MVVCLIIVVCFYMILLILNKHINFLTVYIHWILYLFFYFNLKLILYQLSNVLIYYIIYVVRVIMNCMSLYILLFMILVIKTIQYNH